ncbi:hypothetical protein GCM10009633_23320 [Janibacter melonis]|uniref:hypothetical protein n=1 Tax=Janibacter melonis TaxID=262209 RepID=UPI001E43545C|nr:hypothetical protein [Janibacter melonis]MCB5991528.1 hypothetical protein [Janibacter melonis]
MSTSLHDALAELADDIVPEDVPGGLAESAWSTARVERRRSLSRRSVALLAAAAVTVLLAWVSFGGVSRVDTLPAAPTGPVGYPERVRFQADPPQLPLRSGPVAGLISVGVDDEAAAADDAPIGYPVVNGGSSWQAVLPSGELRSLDDVIPAGDLRPDQASEILDPVALSPDGTKIAAVRHTATVLSDSMSRDSSYDLHIHDLSTGEHHVVEGRRIGLRYDLYDLAWSPDASSVAVRLGDSGGLAVVGADGAIRSAITNASHERYAKGSRTVFLAGWTDDDTVLLATLSARSRAVWPTQADAATGRMTHLPHQPGKDTSGYGNGGYGSPKVTVYDGSLAVATNASKISRWSIYRDLTRTGERGTLECCRHTERSTGEDDTWYGQIYDVGDSMAVVGSSGAGHVWLGDPADVTQRRTLTVVDPSLGGTYVIAPEVYAQGRASRSPFGTWDAAIAWHPWWSVLIAVASVLVVWWVLSNDSRPVRPPWRERRRSRA